MINKENNEKAAPTEPTNTTGYVDAARMDVQCHVLIKDADTKEILVNKRG